MDSCLQWRCRPARAQRKPPEGTDFCDWLIFHGVSAFLPRPRFLVSDIEAVTDGQHLRQGFGSSAKYFSASIPRRSNCSWYWLNTEKFDKTAPPVKCNLTIGIALSRPPFHHTGGPTSMRPSKDCVEFMVSGPLDYSPHTFFARRVLPAAMIPKLSHKDHVTTGRSGRVE